MGDQETQLIALIFQIIAGYSFAILAFDTTKISSHNLLNWVTSGSILLVLSIAIIIGKIDFERTETKKWLGIFFLPN